MSAHNVVLITYGEPTSPTFGAQLAYSWRILLGLTRTIADIPRVLLPMIALYRGYARNRSWTKAGYASPLERITCDQAKSLKETLEAQHPDTEWRVHVAYEFRKPLLKDVLNATPANETVCVVPMYAIDSAFTHGISRATVQQWQARAPHRNLGVRVLPALDPKVLGEIAADHVRRDMSARGVAAGSDCALVLAAHGTLLEPPRPIETGRVATERLCAEIRHRLEGDFGLIVYGWLNHTRGGRWTEPPIDEALQTVTEKGFDRIVYFPYGFLADNAESQLEGQEALKGEPSLNAVHLPCLNVSPALLEALADQVGRSAPRQKEAMPSGRTSRSSSTFSPPSSRRQGRKISQRESSKRSDG